MSILTSSAAPTDPRIFPVDAEHSGVRAVVLIVFILAGILGFMVTGFLIPSDGLNIIALFVGLALAAGAALPLERVLKHRWPSGRSVRVSSDAIRIEKRGTVERQINTEDPVQTVFWRFEVQRRARVPKGWTMLACALEAEGAYLVAYTFASPDTIKRTPHVERFKALISRRNSTGQKDMREDMRLAGEQRRLRDAETQRWMEGAEMTYDDFQAYLQILETRFPEWMPIK
ncbi:MAG: hypothetical protein U0670_20550 [Anaerolineae bacterium]